MLSRIHIRVPALLACAAVAALAAAAPARAEYFGVNAQRMIANLPPDEWGPHLEAIQHAQIDVVRYDARWDFAEPRAPVDGVHTYRWTHFDRVAEALARNGLRWYPILDYTPTWAGSGDWRSAPAAERIDDYAAYARAFADRYGRRGTFWRERPHLSARPVMSYEIWNEPNGPHYWKPAPDARRYADLYMAAQIAIHDADRAAQVVIGGLVTRDAPNFLRAIFVHRPDALGRVDAVGFHPYDSRRVEGVVEHVVSLRRALDELGQVDTPLELTEFGWTTGGDGSVFAVVPDDIRAERYTWLSERIARSDCGVSRFIPHTWMTTERDPMNAEDWFGLYHPNGSPTLAGRAYTNAVARLSPHAGEASLAVCNRTPVVSVASTHLDPARVARSSKQRLARRCFRATVTLAGVPLRGARVLFRADGARTLRRRSGRRGTAGACFRDVRRVRDLRVSASRRDLVRKARVSG